MKEIKSHRLPSNDATIQHNKISILWIEAGEEFRDEIENAKHEEKRANYVAPIFVFEFFVESVQERNVKKHQIIDNCHHWIPIESGFGFEMHSSLNSWKLEGQRNLTWKRCTDEWWIQDGWKHDESSLCWWNRLTETVHGSADASLKL